MLSPAERRVTARGRGGAISDLFGTHLHDVSPPIIPPIYGVSLTILAVLRNVWSGRGRGGDHRRRVRRPLVGRGWHRRGCVGRVTGSWRGRGTGSDGGSLASHIDRHREPGMLSFCASVRGRWCGVWSSHAEVYTVAYDDGSQGETVIS
eukprot:5051257-Prymnesium_polylepis.1